MEREKTYYEILDLPEDASREDIKQAFRSHVKEWHPDIHPEKDNAAEMTQKINEAYGVLSDPNKRFQYDEYLSFTRIQFEPIRNDEADAPADEEADPSSEPKKTVYSNMSFKDYVENVANESFTTYQDIFTESTHKFDEEGYRQYVKNKGTVFDKQIDDDKSKVFLIGFAALMIGFIIYNNSGASVSLSPLFYVVLFVVAAIGIIFEIGKRTKASKEEEERRLGGTDSIAEADDWFDVWLYPEMPLSECRKAFFSFSLRADKHILSRFNNMSKEDREKYADIIELLEECINFRKKK